VGLSDYQDRFTCAALTRTDDGVLTVRLHTKGGTFRWNGRAHGELGDLWTAVNGDRDNRVVVITGTGDSFVDFPEPGRMIDPLVAGVVNATQWDHAIYEGVRLVSGLLDIEVPVIAAVNGPALVHSELAVLADVVLAADTAYFVDNGHCTVGLVPGDGMQIIWPLLLGPNRGRYFLLTGERIDAHEAKRLGIVGEVLPAEKLMARAHDLAHDLAARNPVTMRNTRQVFTRPLKRAVTEDLHYGLALEALAGLSGRDFSPRPPEPRP
jgi:enoyl-CoA hydratase/carnithine racemase